MGHVFGDCSGRVIGAAVAVHSALGPGFLESIYQGALEIELEMRGIEFQRQLEVAVRYRGEVVGRHRLDLLVEESVVVELKAVSAVLEAHLAQLRSYLKATDTKVGILLNFSTPVLGVRRVVN
ncbi:MAG: GxxExxY protein [Gemmatimonadales bacterium]|nr:MAG: GxxExxY protein [Gemmatimonadales bacterium]